MGILKNKGIIKREGKAAKLFSSLTPSGSFCDVVYNQPSEYIKFYWDKYLACSSPKNNSTNGNIFELIIHTLLYREGVLPFYTQAQVAFVPNVNFDTILYSKERPVCLSLKTSLRERYKQADLEAIALKYVHRKAKCYLLTLNGPEAKSNQEKISKGQIIGIDDVIDCNTNQINNLIAELRQNTFCLSEKVDAVKGNLVK